MLRGALAQSGGLRSAASRRAAERAARGGRPAAAVARDARGGAARRPLRRAGVLNGGAAEEAQALIEEVKKKIPQGVIEVRGQISPALGVHTGPGLVGICVLRG